MHHLIHTTHHRHLHTRALLEACGLAVLVGISYSQRAAIGEAVATIAEVPLLWFLATLSIYWIMLPLTSLSYKLLSPKPKKVKLTTTILAHLAGAGPGRIIPGGIGGLSISALHLRKSGLSIEQAIGVVITNNVIGLLVNACVVVVVLLLRPNVFSLFKDNITAPQLIGLIVVSIIVVGLFHWLLHAHRTKKEATKTIRQWKKVTARVIGSPKILCATVGVALSIIGLHTLLLWVAAHALSKDLIFFDALIAMSIGVTIGSLFPTPGGVGGVEAGTSAALVLLGMDVTSATSVAVLFRIATYGQPLFPGTIAYLYLTEKKLL